MNPKPLRHVDLYSTAGRLEALYRDLQDPAGIAVVCHPLPTGGGTLHNKVVFRAARGLEAANVATLRFNFRGVGASGGHFEGGEGEQHDVAAAIEWAKRKLPGKKLIVGGFSFGSWVSTRVACELPEVDALFLIGTPVNKYDFSYLRHCDKPKLFLHGTQDEHGDVAKLEKLIPNVRNAESVIVTGADHFFTKQLEAVEETIRGWAEELIEG
ncbi:MAG TPA: alpha/beta fold hydrolase [Thermoanaerobaculia bacterium]